MTQEQIGEILEFTSWLRDADFENAKIEVEDHEFLSELEWKSGTWKGGTWKNGIFLDKSHLLKVIK